MPSGEAGAACPGEGNPPSSRTVFRGRSATSSQGHRALELMKRGSLERPPRPCWVGSILPPSRGRAKTQRRQGLLQDPPAHPLQRPTLMPS